jgi:polyvinyl alcohol dehydrogenase (cytochrome)
MLHRFRLRRGASIASYARRAALTGSCILAVTMLVAVPANAADGWPTGGQNLQNTRHQASETTIDQATVGTLAPKWTFDTDGDPATVGGDVSATPTFDDDRLYFPDSRGNMYAVDRSSGDVVWKRRIPGATGIANDYARAAPALAGSTLIVGTQSGKFETPSTPADVRGAYVLGYDKHTGVLRWKTKVEKHFSAIVTQSAQVNGNTAYVGLSSNEEASANPAYGGQGQEYACCSFRGSVLALDTKTGAIKWKTYMTPEAYSGAAVWGSTPAVDTNRGALYIATGNNYSLPDNAAACVDEAESRVDKWACMRETSSTRSSPSTSGPARSDGRSRHCPPTRGTPTVACPDTTRRSGPTAPKASAPTTTSARRRCCSAQTSRPSPSISSEPDPRAGSSSPSTATPARWYGTR